MGPRARVARPCTVSRLVVVVMSEGVIVLVRGYSMWKSATWAARPIVARLGQIATFQGPCTNVGRALQPASRPCIRGSWCVSGGAG